MDKNYLVYPCKVMRITQNYKGKTSHYPHTVGLPKDYPIDEGCRDTGRDPLYCPCDKMKVMRIYGIGTGGVNTLWLQSTSKVYFADGTADYFTMLITHPNDDDLKDLKVGQTFKRGQEICKEGKDGATANHFHISGGKGKYKGNGWTKNSRGKYVLTSTNSAYRPEKLFYIDPSFTKVVSAGGIAFKKLPVEYTTGNYEIVSDTLNVRKGASTAYAKIPYERFSKSAKNQIKSLLGDKKPNYFVKGMKLSITKINDNWGKCPTGWICLDYCEKI